MKDEKPAPDRPATPQGPPRGAVAGAQLAKTWGSVHRPQSGATTLEAPAPRQLVPAPSRADKHKVLRARARALAREPLDRSAPEGRIEVVEFVLSGEHYAVESTQVREVYPLKELTPLPCTPAFILGIINLRGQILAVMDIRRFFDLPIKGITDLNKVIVLQAGEVQVGILADAVLGVRSVSNADLQPPLPTMTGVRAEYLQGVTSDRLAVLNAAKILGDEKIVVHDEVEA